jgi:hypothetical protein
MGVELSIVMPCLNEAETLAPCIEKARRYLARSSVSGEIVAGDNGSTDGSPEIGFELAAFAVFTKVFAISEGLLPEDPRLNHAFRYITLETGLAAGGALMAVGIVGSILAVTVWSRQGFGALDASRMLRIVMPSVFSLTLGVQVVCSSFFLSILGLRRR